VPEPPVSRQLLYIYQGEYRRDGEGGGPVKGSRSEEGKKREREREEETATNELQQTAIKKETTPRKRQLAVCCEKGCQISGR
jgi:hypothetical protein